MIYDNHVFVVEVKGGAFAYTSPATDFDAYKKAVRDLFGKPAHQAHRCAYELDAAGKLELHDKEHNHVITLRKTAQP